MVPVAKALGMDVIAWSQNLTAERCAELGVTRVTKDELLSVGRRPRGLPRLLRALPQHAAGGRPGQDEAGRHLGEHLPRSDRRRGGPHRGAPLRPRWPGPASTSSTASRCPADHPFRSLDNVVVTPHIGYVTEQGFRAAWQRMAEDVARLPRGIADPGRHRPGRLPADGTAVAPASMAADSAKLTAYQRKRDFAQTPEPAGSPPRAQDEGAPRFVVQLHRARRTHYDLRFEIGGVLVSWAVPRGPTLDPEVKRTAVHVEDHPIEYLDFEGVIPSGQYGGGDVIVWDTGTWEPHATDDPAAAVAAGEFHADLHGRKAPRPADPGPTGTRPVRPGAVAAAAQARRVRGQRLGAGGLPAIGAQRPHQRRGQGRPGPALAVRPAAVAGVGRHRRPGRDRGRSRGRSRPG